MDAIADIFQFIGKWLYIGMLIMFELFAIWVVASGIFCLPIFDFLAFWRKDD